MTQPTPPKRPSNASYPVAGAKRTSFALQKDVITEARAAFYTTWLHEQGESLRLWVNDAIEARLALTPAERAATSNELGPVPPGKTSPTTLDIYLEALARIDNALSEDAYHHQSTRTASRSTFITDALRAATEDVRRRHGTLETSPPRLPVRPRRP